MVPAGASHSTIYKCTEACKEVCTCITAQQSLHKLEHWKLAEKLAEEMMRVAVVGAGVSGLAAAHELARAGAPASLYTRRKTILVGSRPGPWPSTTAAEPSLLTSTSVSCCSPGWELAGITKALFVGTGDQYRIHITLQQIKSVGSC
jgi:choline dehydrogenase-like flavoprotein